MFVNSLNMFRGLVILLVVAGHTFEISNIQFDTFGERLAGNFVNGATTTFVFLSGFLFHHVFYKKFDYAKFIKSKALNVLIPYAILSTIAIIITIISGRHFSEYFAPDENGLVEGWLTPYVKYFVTGRVLTAYWYVPFIFCTFLISPLHILFIRLPNGVQLVLIVVFYGISALMHRPVSNINLIQNVAYAIGPYFLGIWCSINKQAIYAKFEGKEWLPFSAFAAILLTQTVLGYSGNFHKPAFEWGGLDLMLLQKAALSLFLMTFLHKFEDRNWWVIDTLAAVSFAIFFIHPWFLRVIDAYEKKVGYNDENWPLYVLATITITFLCAAIALLAKKVLGKNSRLLIGY